jgi:hypothetical protein
VGFEKEGKKLLSVVDECCSLKVHQFDFADAAVADDDVADADVAVDDDDGQMKERVNGTETDCLIGDATPEPMLHPLHDPLFPTPTRTLGHDDVNETNPAHSE